MKLNITDPEAEKVKFIFKNKEEVDFDKIKKRIKENKKADINKILKNGKALFLAYDQGLEHGPSDFNDKNVNLSELLKLTDILILNKEEALLLIRKKQNLLENLQKLGPRIVVITEKDKMISCYDGKKKYYLKPHRIKVVERTGAGDAFASGFVAGQIVGKSITESLKLGLRESESVIRYFGAKNKLLRMRLK